jgi:hypothetical protein
MLVSGFEKRKTSYIIDSLTGRIDLDTKSRVISIASLIYSLNRRCKRDILQYRQCKIQLFACFPVRYVTEVHASAFERRRGDEQTPGPLDKRGGCIYPTKLVRLTYLIINGF